MTKEITLKDIEAFEADLEKRPAAKLARNAVTKNGIANAAMNYDRVSAPHTFSIEVNAGEVCNQKQSGRCWMFASLNVMRLNVMKKLKLKNVELSQSYPLFFDKLERSNHFLENIIATADEDLDSRNVWFLLQDPVGDGGQWDMFRSIIEKYGIVPKDVYPETAVSEGTRELNDYLTKKLRGFAMELRNAKADGKSLRALRQMKGEMMNTVYRMLVTALGKPPVSFNWNVKDKDDKIVTVKNMTPKKFFDKYIGWNLDEMVTVINAPTKDKPYHRTYTVQFLGCVEEARYPVKYLNLPMDELKRLTIEQLKAGEAVWFGSDVGQFSDRKGGYLIEDAVDAAGLFDTDFPMNKAERLDYCESLMTHAMVITGVELDGRGRALYWKVENSWGEDVGFKGFYTMSDKWFSEFAYQILLNKKYLTQEERREFDSKPIVLKPWDPMGSLAV